MEKAKRSLLTLYVKNKMYVKGEQHTLQFASTNLGRVALKYQDQNQFTKPKISKPKLWC